MLSKVLRAGDFEKARPIAWRQASLVERGSIPRSAPGTEPAGKANSPVSEEQVRTLRTRAADLETALDQRAREARESGYRDGFSAGADQAAAQVRPVLEKLARSIQELADLRPAMRNQAEADVVRLALAIARKVIHRELNTDPDSLMGLVSVSLVKLKTQEATRVRVHPSHLNVLGELLNRSPEHAHIVVTGDASLGAGGIVFETSRGEFDASVDTHLKEIERGLTDRLAH